MSHVELTFEGILYLGQNIAVYSNLAIIGSISDDEIDRVLEMCNLQRDLSKPNNINNGRSVIYLISK